MNCNEVRDEFSALIDGELSADARERVEAHLSECADCLRALGKMKRVDGLYRSLAPQAAPEGFEERVRVAVATPREVKRRITRPVWRWWPAWVAVAACVAIVVSVGVLRTGARPGRFNVASVETKLETSVPKGVVEENVRTGATNQPVPQAESVQTPADASRESAEGDIHAEKEQSAEVPSRIVRDDATLQKEELPAAASPPPKAGTAKSRVVSTEKLAPKLEAKQEMNPATVAARVPTSVTQAPAASIPPSPTAPQVAEKSVQERASMSAQAEVKADSAPPSPPPPAAVSRGAEGKSPARPESPPVPPPARAMTLKAAPVQRNSAALPALSEPAAMSTRTASDTSGAAPSLAKPMAKALPDGMAKGAADATEKKDAGKADLRTVAGRTFTLRDGVWQQDGYTKDTRAKTLRRDSRTLETFLKKHPDVKPILEIGDRVVFQYEGRWYRTEPKE